MINPLVVAKVGKWPIASQIHWALAVVDQEARQIEAAIDFNAHWVFHSSYENAYINEATLVEKIRTIGRHANFALDLVDARPICEMCGHEPIGESK